MERKGQAAMEFLMTYGWAILAAIVAIGVLAYFGVFSPGKYISNVCTINAPFGCEEYSLAVDTITLAIRNGGGDSFGVSSILVEGCAEDTTAYTVPDGELVNTDNVVIDCSVAGGGAGLASGDKVKKDITITYTKTGGTVAQSATGSISGRVP